MALLKTEAEKLSNNDLVRGVIEEIIDRDGVFNLLPFVRTNGKAYVYNRENTIDAGDSNWLAPNATVPEGAATFTEVTTTLTILAGDVDVDKFLDETMNDTNDQVGTQLGLKAKALGREFQKKLINGTGASNQFTGMSGLVDAGQQIDNASVDSLRTMTLEDLDQLIDQVPNGCDAIVMHPVVIRKYKQLLRSFGGTDAYMAQLKNFSAPILTHNGVPIVVNDFISIIDQNGSSGANGSSVYAVRFNEMDGLHGIYGGASAGMRVENIGTVQDKDAWRLRLKWYCGLALKSTKSLAELQYIDAS